MPAPPPPGSPPTPPPVSPPVSPLATPLASPLASPLAAPLAAPPPLALAIVIPVRDDAAGLARLLPALADLPGLAQVILVDDASVAPVGDLPGAAGLPLTILRNDRPQGAGQARNRGLDAVTAPHVMFLDSDDLPLPALAEVLADLADRADPVAGFDFCLFRHTDGQPGPDMHGPDMQGTGLLPGDQLQWDLAGLGRAPAPPLPVTLTPAQAARMCRISAYPWNKVYRTAFLRAHAIRCTETLLHNDIALHWLGFFHAGRILVSHRTALCHVVAPDGARLSNNTGAARFEVFRALDALQDALAADPARAARFADAVVEFYLNIFVWIDAVIAPGLRPAFGQAARAFLLARLSPAVVTLVALADPPGAARLNRFLGGV